MKCPHCLIAFHADKPTKYSLGEDIDAMWDVINTQCPSCGKYIISLECTPTFKDKIFGIKSQLPTRTIHVHPKGSSRPPAPSEVPSEIALDYSEACLVLPDSPKASAALSRRCLQSLLREHVKVKKGVLAKEIQEVIDAGTLPSHLVSSIDAIRNIGNFAAHPIKSEKSGEIFPVEPGEAEWNLDVLEALFDFYFVQPAEIQRKRDALNKKLKDAGAKDMK